MKKAQAKRFQKGNCALALPGSRFWIVEKSAGTWREHNMLIVKCESRAKPFAHDSHITGKKEIDPTTNMLRGFYVEPTK